MHCILAAVMCKTGKLYMGIWYYMRLCEMRSIWRQFEDIVNARHKNEYFKLLEDHETYS